MQTNSELLEKFNLNWNVEKRNLGFQTPEGIYVPTSEYGLVRTDNNVCLGVCKKDYHPFQNDSVLTTLKQFADKHNIEIDNGGSFGGGKRIYFQLKVSESLKIGNDTVKEYIFAGNSFDKTLQLVFGYTSVVISCQNTFNRVMKNDVSYKYRHTIDSQTKIIELTDLFEQHFNFRQEVNNNFKKWHDIQLPTGMVNDLVEKLMKTDKLGEIEDLSTRKKGIIENLNIGITKELNEKGNSLWGLFNGVTYYANHLSSIKTRENSRNESILNGLGHKTMNDAYDYIEAYAEAV